MAKAKQNLERYLARTKFKRIDQIKEAFSLCKTNDDIQKVCDTLKYKYNNAFGTFYLCNISEDNNQFTIVQKVPALDEFDIDFVEHYIFKFFREE